MWMATQFKYSKKKNLKNVLSCYIISVTLAIQKVCSHEQFQCDLRSDGKFRYFCGAVGVTDLVGEIHADLGQDMRGNLPEVHFIGFILSKLTCGRRVTVDVTSRNNELRHTILNSNQRVVWRDTAPPTGQRQLTWLNKHRYLNHAKPHHCTHFTHSVTHILIDGGQQCGYS